jgi:hypothetical protein
VAEAGGLLIRKDAWLWPGVARNLALAHVDTPFVAFIDNDVVVETGWLGKLLAAAQETGAALVGPLYLVSDGVGEARIHMAGGTLARVATPSGTALHERHDRLDAPLAERAQLTRTACDFVEYHCMLARTDFLRRAGPLSEDIVCVHEHIDVALAAKAAGLAVVFEPAAAVTQYVDAPYALADLPFHRWRWRREAVDASLAAFAAKWNVTDDGEATRGVRAFVDGLTARRDPLVPWLEPARARAPLDAGDVKQSLYGLLTQAHAQGYGQADLDLFAKTYRAAMSLFAGGFRPCGRPFLDHCVGTASALVAFAFAPRLVVAGLLHGAYTHAPLGPEPHAALGELDGRIGAAFGARVANLVRAYARSETAPDAWREAHPAQSLSVDDAEILAIALAAEIDKRASGEIAFAAERPPPAPEWEAYFAKLSAALAVPAFAQTLRELAYAAPPEGFAMRRQHKESFRLVPGGTAPMAHGAFAAWDAR